MLKNNSRFETLGGFATSSSPAFSSDLGLTAKMYFFCLVCHWSGPSSRPFLQRYKRDRHTPVCIHNDSLRFSNEVVELIFIIFHIIMDYFCRIVLMMSLLFMVSSLAINKRSETQFTDEILALASTNSVTAQQPTTTAQNSKRDCFPSEPCSWDVYRPFSYPRLFEHSVYNNDCKCSVGTRCKRARQDVSMSMYVNKCLSDFDRLS